MVGLAHAAMDVSDGLVQDLGHLCAASGVAAVIAAERVPLSPPARRAIAANHSLLATALTGGDDYEVLITAPAAAAEGIAALAGATGVAMTPIGHIEAGAGVTVIDGAGAAMPLDRGGWRHFTGDRT